jgi:hypothetical protein
MSILLRQFTAGGVATIEKNRAGGFDLRLAGRTLARATTLVATLQAAEHETDPPMPRGHWEITDAKAEPGPSH